MPISVKNINVKGKKVLKRVDLNLPIKNGILQPNPRLQRHAESIKELSEKGARLIILAHQGKPGSKDFTTLKNHADFLEKEVGKPVMFFPKTTGPEVIEKINSLKDGQILLLENVRMVEGEMENKLKLVEELSPHVDYYVLDALSVAHRPQSSIIGFSKHVPCFMGPVLKKEISALDKVGSSNITLVIGGSKVGDSLDLMENWLSSEKTDKILVGGALASLFLHAKGYIIAGSLEYLRQEGFLIFTEKARKLLQKYEEKIMLPVDVAINIKGERVESGVDNIKEGQIWDIGSKTAELYRIEILNSKNILVNGPVGVYESKNFSQGTKRILEAIAESPAFSVVGGGHTITAIRNLGLDEKKFGYISLSGKALVEYLSGKELPALKALKESRLKFNL